MFYETIKNQLRPLFGDRTILNIIRFGEACKYVDWRIWAKEVGNRTIKAALLSDKPQAIGKLGSVELQAIRSYLRLRHKPDWQYATHSYRRTLFTNAGVFPNHPEILERYCEYMLQDILPEITIMAVYYNFGEAKIVRKYAPSAEVIAARSLESYYLSQNRWTSVLEAKTVLVVHPFFASIKKQFERRKEIWPGKDDIFPKFELLQVKVPQLPSLVCTASPDWFSSLDEIKHQMSVFDFDVALIGAGAYSLPLAVQAKKMGKHGIHLGGATQIYFGIKGGRWDNHPVVSKFYNEHWIRPLPQDTPANNLIVENGGYW